MQAGKSAAEPLAGDWFVNLPIQTKLAAAFLALLAVLVTSMGLYFREVERLEQAREWTGHTFEVIDRLQQLTHVVMRQQADLRAHVTTGQSGFLAGFRQLTLDWDAAWKALREVVADNPVQLEHMAEVDELLQAWRRDVAEVQIAEAGRAGDSSGTRLAQLLAESRAAVDPVLARLDRMVRVERALLAPRERAVAETIADVRVTLIVMLLVALVATALSVWLVRVQVTGPVGALTATMKQLARGELDVGIPYRGRRDEVGAIARALEVFQQASVEVHRRAWVKSRLAEVNEALTRHESFADFGNLLLARLCPVVGAGYGMLFRRHPDDDSMVPIGNYGFRERRAIGRPLGQDQGLVGQCAHQGRVLEVDAVPPDYVRIGSGLGEAPPRVLVLWPLPGSDGTAGVLELASFAPFTLEQRELIEEVARLAGMALEALGHSLRTGELLQSTQAQAEELQASEEALKAQQEELRASNEALQEQARTLEDQGQKLRVSEEELKIQAEELRQANDELHEHQQRLETIRRELELKNTDVERASRYKSEFLANMSHELRTPLNALLILARSLADNDTGNLNDEQVESARVIHDSGSNLLALINDILDLSKIESGRMDVLIEPVALRAFATGLDRNFRHFARERSLEFVVTVAPDVPAELHTDGGKLKQVMYNLLGNAFKFTHAGGVYVGIERSPNGVRFTVRDTGIGIPVEKQSRMFQSFEQADSSTSRKYGGTGLGLAISRRLAVMLGGDIGLDSEEGRGSTFTLKLPLEPPQGASLAAQRAASAPAAGEAPQAAAPAAAQADTPEARDVAKEPPRAPRPLAAPPLADDRDRIAPGDTVILVIEDDLAFAKIVADLARRKNYRTLLAASGEEGVRLAVEYQPTGIILDVGLPDLDGWQVLQRLKDDPVTRHIPVHFITAADDSARALSLGAAGFITKPVTREMVEGAFERVLHFTAGSPRRVLVVDDDAASRAAITALIREPEVELVEAATAEEGLRLLAGSAFDCLILDLTLPDLSGFEFLERASRTAPVPPVVVYSARDLSADENLKLRQYTDSIVIKGARSPERLLDEVSLFLHAIRKAGAAPVATPVAPALDLAGHRVLLVDDDMRNVFALGKALRDKGLKVELAQDGHKALAQLEAHPGIELVLMDIMMPGMDGYEAMRRIRAQEKWKQLPIIALTAKAMRGDREKCLDAGASDYLSKPIELERLLDLMRVWLAGR